MVRTDNFEEQEEWEFDKILDCGQKEGNYHWEYLIKWKTGDLSWEPVSHVIDCETRL